jgi:hypothetical protein
MWMGTSWVDPVKLVGTVPQDRILVLRALQVPIKTLQVVALSMIVFCVLLVNFAVELLVPVQLVLVKQGITVKKELKMLKKTLHQKVVTVQVGKVLLLCAILELMLLPPSPLMHV